MLLFLRRKFEDGSIFFYGASEKLHGGLLMGYESLQCAQQRLLAAEPLNGVQIDSARA